MLQTKKQRSSVNHWLVQVQFIFVSTAYHGNNRYVKLHSYQPGFPGVTITALKTSDGWDEAYVTPNLTFAAGVGNSHDE